MGIDPVNDAQPTYKEPKRPSRQQPRKIGSHKPVRSVEHDRSERATETAATMVLVLFGAVLAYGVLSQGLLFSPPLWVVGLIILALVVYFVPAKIAYDRNVKQKKAILGLNIFLGWTFVFWSLALVWAYVEE